MGKKPSNPFDKWTAEKRLSEAQVRTDRLVGELLNLIYTHQNVRRLVLTPAVAKKVPRSYAAKSFNSLSHDITGFELLRLCAAWDGVQPGRISDKASIPAILWLLNDEATRNLTHNELLRRWGNVARSPSGEEDPALSREIEALLRRERLEYRVPKDIHRLLWAYAEAERMQKSPQLAAARHHRNAYLAHNIEMERDPNTPKVMYRDLLAILLSSVRVVWCLNNVLNGTDTDFLNTLKMARLSAGELWNGVSFDIPNAGRLRRGLK